MRRWGTLAAGLPLALLPTVWYGGITTPADAQLLPDGSAMPTSAVSAPASLTPPELFEQALAALVPPAAAEPTELTPGIVVADAEGASDNGALTPATEQTGYDIPGPALAAYQRAQTVINAADPGCGLPWQLLAAIGRVESNHGRFGGSQLGSDGVARPPIMGIPLTGEGTTKVTDTDDGALDDDTQWDRAVGPMQFIPSTWAVVGVDADGDKVRNPQDIDDAALAAAVYLCSGDGDLSTTRGQEDAVYRYNHSASYVDLVLSIAADYGASGVTGTPAVYVPPATATPSNSPAAPPTSPTSPSAPTSASPQPAQPGSGPNAPVLPPVSEPAPGTVLSAPEAAAQCLTEGYVNNPLRSGDAFDRCVARYTR